MTLCCCVPLHTMEASQPGRPLVRVDSGQQRCVRHLHSRRHSAASAACDACTGTAGNRHVGIGARVTANTDGACNAGDAAALGLPCAPTTHPVSVATHAQHPLSRSARTRFTAPLARSMPSILNAYRSSAMDMALSPACMPSRPHRSAVSVQGAGGCRHTVPYLAQRVHVSASDYQPSHKLKVCGSCRQ